MSAFDDAFNFVVGQEGGYVDDPQDPGGETKYGISKASYPNLDIANLTLDQAKTIYLSDYWNRSNCDALPSCLQVAVFQASVLQGVGTAGRTLQEALGVSADGVIGDETIAAAQKADAKAALAEFMTLSLFAESQLPTWSVYGKGWTHRAFMTMVQALS